MPLLSIITINYNDKKGLDATLNSVHNQTLKEFEHIVVDGASTDGSVELLQKTAYTLTYHTEPDTGVYNAMNKGINMSQGKYLLFLNAGDIFNNDTVLEKVLPELGSDLDIYYGNLYFEQGEKSFVRSYPDTLRFSHFLEKSLPHPASFIKKELFENHFYYTESYRIVSDWEFFVYTICKAGVSYKHIDEVVSSFDMKGMSNDPKNKALIKKEREQVLQKHFPAFLEDYEVASAQKAVLEKSNFKLLASLSKTKSGRKWSARLLKGLNMFIK